MEDNKTLEAIIKLRDEISKPLKDVQKALDNTKKATEPVSKELSKLQKIINTVKPILLAVKDKASPIAKKVQRILQKLTGKHWDTIIKAKDMATKVVSKVKGVLQAITSKAWSAMLKAQDKISPIVGKVKGILKGITGKAWSALVKVKDMASSVLSKIKGMLVGLAAGATIGVKVAVDGLIQEQNNKITIDRVLKNAGLKDYKKVGEEYYKYLEDYANATPFTTAEMATAGTKAMMMAKGDTGQAKQILDMIANTKAFVGDNRTMQEVIEAYFSAKNGNMESLNNILGENFTSFEDAQKQVLEKYGGLVQEQSKTLGGLLSTIKGKIAVNLKDMLSPFKDFMTNGMTNFITFLDDVKPKLDAFAQSVAKGFQEFSKSQTASNLLQVFQTVATTVWNAIKTVIDAVSPTIKNIFNWIGDHSEQIQEAIQTLGDIWDIVWDAIQIAIETAWPIIGQILEWIFDHIGTVKTVVETLKTVWEKVWGILGPVLQAAWSVIKPILDGIAGAIETVCGVVNGLVDAFERLADVFGSGDVQKALNASNSVKTDPTYGAYTQIKDRAMGQRVIPRDNFPINAHQGEMLLTAREVRQYKNKGNTPQIVNNFYGMTVRQEADIEKVTSGIVRKLNEQRIVLG